MYLMSLTGLFFGRFEKKLKLQKTQNSGKILEKLKRDSEKTQKPATQVQLTWS